jgi:hypothetical protein
MKRPARVAAQLSASLHRRLNAYALVASATGVGLLALSQPAESKIVYTQTDFIIASGNSYYLLNPADQGVAPFIFWGTFVFQTSGVFGDRACFRPYGEGASILLAANDLPVALHAGSVIGQGENFGSGRSGGMLFTYGPYFGGTSKHHKGNFKFDQKQYLGFKFSISGKPHFGWARVKPAIHPYFKDTKYTNIRLLGYAYETIPNKPIIAGQTHGGN